jgi:hypothetical protein
LVGRRGDSVNIGKSNDIGYNANSGGFYGCFLGGITVSDIDVLEIESTQK